YVSYGNFTPQIYVREARRMVSDYVMTELHCRQAGVSAEQSIGMGAYTMDSHHVQRYVNDDGWVKNEGDVEVGGFKPYPIDYRSIVPKKNECGNLFVPVCLSSTHMAFGSIRMEPVFMVLGQSAALAACLAIDEKIPVQDIDYEVLKTILLEKDVILKYPD
ncbi:MAG: FAD-dependent oxidoreductase, partial [Tissierellia bacterium]|nr:FAD-dependent oxidoreductase [Tissierellia bacterium]